MNADFSEHIVGQYQHLDLSLFLQPVQQIIELMIVEIDLHQFEDANWLLQF